jgi:hypothetical protein
MNQYYSAELSQKVTRGMRETRAKGNFPGGSLLYGYRVENKKVLVDEKEAEIVRYIFQESAAGKPGNVIIDELNNRGNLYRGKPFSKTTFYRLMGNEKYIGIFRHDDEVLTNIYPPIISEELFGIVKSRLENNKSGKHKPDVCYLLKYKLQCGYCGKPVGSNSGVSQTGALMRYYRCNGKIKPNTCDLKPIRKELLEDIVTDITYEVLKEKIDLSDLAEKIFEIHKKRLDDKSTLNMLTADYNEIEKSINNLLKAMEQGIITDSTKERLEMLEKQKSELVIKISAEQSRNKLLITKEEIINYFKKQLKRQPKFMIYTFVKKVVLYNDKIEIFYNYIDKEPDGDNDRQAFSFYECKKSYIINKHKLGGLPESLDFFIKMFIAT